MKDDLKAFLQAGAAKMKERDEWLNRLGAEPHTATGLDVRKLVERIRGLEWALNDYYRECTCSAGLTIAIQLQGQFDKENARG